MTNFFKFLGGLFKLVFNLCLVCVIVIGLFAAYFLVFNPAVEYEFFGSEEDFASISIATLTVTEEGYETEDVLVIDDVDAFIDDFRAVTCHRKIGAKLSFDESDNGKEVIKITYVNGDVELISASCHNTLRDDYVLYLGRFVFDETEFSSLINTWKLK